jgi:hypothetical protein
MLRRASRAHPLPRMQPYNAEPRRGGTHVLRTAVERLDRSVFEQPSEWGESRLPYCRHSDDHRLSRSTISHSFCYGVLAHSCRNVRSRLDLAIYRTCVRRQASRVLPRLAVLAGGSEMVGSEGQRQSLTIRHRQPFQQNVTLRPGLVDILSLSLADCDLLHRL